MVDVKKLVEWLGPEGASVGLERSDLTVAVLRELASSAELSLPKKLGRSKLIAAIIDAHDRKIDRTVNELLAMDQDRLGTYLRDVSPSRRELMRLLAEIDIRPPGKTRGNLLDFVVREISDIGMYQRVAKGDSKR